MKYLLLFLLYCVPIASFAQEHTSLFDKLSELSEQGNMEAAYHLGMLYNNGIGTQKNIELAYNWFKKSGEANDPLGSYKLGCYFAGQAGDLVQYDEEKALKYKLVSTNAGYSYAQFDVGMAYLIRKENVLAIRYLEKSLKQGYLPAFAILRGVYWKGEIVEQYLVKAHAYTSIPELILFGEIKGLNIRILDDIEKGMNSKQIDESNVFVENWKPSLTHITKIAQKGLVRSYEITGLSIPSSK